MPKLVTCPLCMIVKACAKEHVSQPKTTVKRINPATTLCWLTKKHNKCQKGQYDGKTKN